MANSTAAAPAQELPNKATPTASGSSNISAR